MPPYFLPELDPRRAIPAMPGGAINLSFALAGSLVGVCVLSSFVRRRAVKLLRPGSADAGNGRLGGV